ncbi:MAG TPA: DinB family protein [Saprospiraceae bacterium]|nr:DinB family protein [Saprospiraceae bacterium]
MSQSELLDHLEESLQQLLKEVREHFAEASLAMLKQRPTPEQWSAMDCFAHLNAQFEGYLSRMELALHKAKARKWTPAQEWRSNWLGSSAIRKADPSNPKLRKSHKSINPLKKLAVRDTELKAFLINAEMLLRLIRQAREVDINKASVKPLRWSLYRFRLGDLMEYLVLHARRHILQAKKASA